MEAAALDWANLALRWLHVIAGIAWIGESFYFMWLDASLEARTGLPIGVKGESWIVHGGGFYHVEKFLVAPDALPDRLHWFKYEAYTTWASGFLLLCVIYYAGAATYLVDPAVAALSPGLAIGLSAGSLGLGWLVYHGLCRSPLGRRPGVLTAAVFVLVAVSAWGYFHLFGGRAAALHVGAFLGTLMAANVFFVIIPNQKRMVAALLAGREPQAALGVEGKQRSTHNNYFTLGAVLMMVSGHYPALYAHRFGWASVLAMLVVGALIRDAVNRRNAGAGGVAWRGVGAVAVFAAVVVLSLRLSARPPEATTTAAVTTAEVEAIVARRCAACHARVPSDRTFDAPPAGVVLESAADVLRHRDRVRALAVASRAMPLANKTGMTDDERARLGRWLAAH